MRILPPVEEEIRRVVRDANGMYKKPIDAIAKEFQYEPLPGEVRAVVIAAWLRGGLLPKAVIE